ncbi:MAG: PD-(D/E)XK nuclease family protein [Microthrixaceae bacterium]
MALEVVWTGYGRAAAVALRDAVVAAKAGEPLAPVTVVVPSNHVGVAARRMLSSGALGAVTPQGSGIAAVTFVTPFRLAELLGAASLAASGRRPVSTPVLAAAMRAELAADAGLFEPVKQHPATESALVSTYRELRDVSPAALDALAATSARAAEVVRLHRTARARLEPSWSDEEDLLDAATGLAGSPAAAELGALIIHLPQRLSQHSARLLAALAEHVPTTVIAGCSGVAAADAEMVESLRRLGVGTTGGADVPTDLPVSEERTVILTASDGDEEVRAAVRAVIDAARAGTRLDRIAVLHASPEPYARLAHEQLHAAGVSTNGAAVVPLAARMAGRTLLDLLALPDNDFRRQDVFALLSAGPVLHKGRWAPVTAWERLSRDAAVVAGRHDWDAHLTQEADKLTQRAEARAQDPDASSGSVERLRKDAARATELRSFVLALIDDLARAALGEHRWSEHAAWAQRWLRDLLGQAGRRDSWPPDERRAAERVEVALERLGALDAVEGPVPLEVFARTLTVELEADLGRVGRFGEGVLVGSVEMGIGLDLDLVVILGLAEGSFPATVRDDSLLPDRERAACGDELGLRADRVERQHRHLLGALAGANRQLLCVPRGDLRRSVDRVPSRWVLDIATHLAQSTERWWGADLHRATQPWTRHVASFDAGLRSMAVPSTDQEHRLRALLASGGSLSATNDERTAAGAGVLAARRSTSFTRFDGNLVGLAVPSPLDQLTSPTRLERWASCPHAHFVLDVLAVDPIENPEDTLAITALEKGTLVHSILEEFIGEVLARPEADRPGPADPWTVEDHLRLQAIGERRCDEAEAKGITGRPIFWKRDRRRILSDLDLFLVADARYRATHGTVPIAVELGFGFGDLDAVSVPLPDGRVLRVRGRADRLDRAVDGTLHVVDYKTGRFGDSYRGLSEDDPVKAGTKLQLPLYGLAARLADGHPDAPVRADYWFPTTRGEFKRTGYVVTDDVLAITVATLGIIVHGVESGVFPPHPDGAGTFFYISCEVCDPDGLGTVELHRQWEHKLGDPALADYVALVS